MKNICQRKYIVIIDFLFLFIKFNYQNLSHKYIQILTNLLQKKNKSKYLSMCQRRTQ